MPEGRTIASGQVFQRFIRQLSQQAKMSADDIERSIVNYIKTRASNNAHGNYMAIGITEKQAQKIKNLSDDLPFMPKVRKWAMENIDKINPSIRRKMAAEVYEAIVVGKRGLTNPYTFQTAVRTSSRRVRREVVSPIQSISEKQQRILNNIRGIKSRGIQNTYRKNLAAMQSRGSQNPAVFANGQEIVESAARISRKTGIKAMGDGCENFSKSASAEILEIKANVDLYRAKLIEEMAHNKANRIFASVDDIPTSLRLTADDVDQATMKAFQDVLGYTDDEARLALKRLKGKPCKLY